MKNTFTIEVNGKKIQASVDGNSLEINNHSFEADISQLDKNNFHALLKNKSYRVEVLSINKEEKTFSIKVNNRIYNLTAKDKYDALLQEMGFDKKSGNKNADVKAPMPGLVLRVQAEAGQQIKKGDALLVLEAMKMENVIKAPADGTIKKVSVKQGDKVEKNQVMISF